MKKNFARISALSLLVAVSLSLGGCDSKLFSKSTTITPEAAKLKMETFINDNLMTPGSKATIQKVAEENGLYKMTIDIGSGQVIDSYSTKDGSIFFPNALNVKEIEDKAAATKGGATSTDSASAPVQQNIPKTAKPVVELFVMSHCPYGTQIEKGMIPVIEALKAKADIQIKFVDYSMHGDKELKEELNQYCINKEQTPKYISYLKCFLGAGDSAACLASTKIDTAKLNTCAAKTDKQFSVTTGTEKKGSYPVVNLYKADNAKYSVGGSPTLIINGVESQSGRDSASLLASVCSAFTTQPAECKLALSSASPAPGFGTGTSAGGAAASCGSN
ncbi:MAG: thioredoxin domain-containing protein [Candidatus Falkowbacteria bacterium]